ncbi:class I SAM-dependent methyltransferase [Salinisphaera hydrothermalis]|nr:class I SAM-dependent methyltransferase [Salinisphaera hydrothermalis]
MSQRIGRTGFDARFAADSDPWGTFVHRDEARKRRAILCALGAGLQGRVLELGCGNGSNSIALARRAWTLDACDAAPSAVRLTAAALADQPRASVYCRVLPGRFPRARYDAVVIAELLYYLRPYAMQRLAADVGRALTPGGRLVLAHHHVDFHDTAQTSRAIHRRFIAHTGRSWHPRFQHQNRRWTVESGRLVSPALPARDRSRTPPRYTSRRP